MNLCWQADLNPLGQPQEQLLWMIHKHGGMKPQLNSRGNMAKEEVQKPLHRLYSCRLNPQNQLGRLCVYGIYWRTMRVPTKELVLDFLFFFLFPLLRLLILLLPLTLFKLLRTFFFLSTLFISFIYLYLYIGFLWLYRVFSCFGEGNVNPLLCSCLENPRDRGAWWAAIYGVAQSRTQLKRLSSSSSRIFST